MRFGRIIKLFERGNVSVCGLRGRGKDMLMSNVVVRRNKPYVSNVDYGGQFIPYDYSLIAQPNTYDDFLRSTIKRWVYSLEDGVDFYLSDAGVYFPSQYNGELNRKYPALPTFMALSRHLGACNVHYNAQALNRVWDKIREQSDTYINCRRCIYIKPLRLVIQVVRIYERYDSAVDNYPPFRTRAPLLSPSEAKTAVDIQRDQYAAQHGIIKTRILIYRNRSTYDTRHFKTLLERGVDDDS